MHLDVMIVGGGLVGTAMAKALSSSTLKVGLVEATQRASEDHRLIALNNSSVSFLKNLHLWPLQAEQATPIRMIHISKRGAFGSTQIKACDANLPALGYVVPAKNLNPLFKSTLSSLACHICPGRLKNIIQKPTHNVLTLETAQGTTEISATLVIGADGSHSTVRKCLNIPTEEHDYCQSALVTTTLLQRPHQEIAYERFQDKGAIALLPLQDKAVATIWSGETEEIARLMELNDEAFLKQLQHQFGYRLGRFRQVFKRHSYPLYRIKAKTQKIGNAILIGNAAHTLHPITAQGLNLSIYEIAYLAEYLMEEKNKLSLNNLNLPSSTFLLDLSHHISHLFSNDFFLLNAARQFGMISFDLSKTLKRSFTRKLLGHTAEFPALLKDRMLNEDHAY